MMEKKLRITPLMLALALLISQTILAQRKAEMVDIKGGTFTMGLVGNETGDDDEKPPHEVTVSDFRIGKYEVSVEEYEVFAQATGKAMPSKPDSLWFIEHPDTYIYWNTLPGVSWWGLQKDYPIFKVTWYDAVEYCNWLSQKDGLEPAYTIDGENTVCDFNKNGYRLPTEAEWEYAARGGTGHDYVFAGSNTVEEVGWVDVTTKLIGPQKIGQKKPNGYGLYDMTGNVWEWCNDFYAGNYYQNSPSVDPRGAQPTIYRVLRGGGWHYRAEYATVTSRDGPMPTYTNYNYGFRLAQSVVK